MSFIKKTILLTNSKNNGISVLNIYRSGEGIFASLKNYNDFKEDIVLGICTDGKEVLKQNIVANNDGNYHFKLDNNFDLNSKIGCVLMKKIDRGVVPILWGSNGDIVDYKSIVVNTIRKELEGRYNAQNTSNSNCSSPSSPSSSAKERVHSVSNLKDNNLESEPLLFDAQKKVVQKEKSVENQSVSGASTVQYETGNRGKLQEREEDIKSAKLFESSDEEIEKEIDKVINQDSFYNMISGQIEELFENYPNEARLEKLIPQSKWVKVDFENNGKYYVVGLIYENGVLKFVAYGVPGEYSKEPPSDLEAYSQWIPLDISKEEGEGFWIMYQDAETGESLKLEIV